MVGRKDKLQQIMTQPINQIFRFFTSGTRVQIWLYDQPNLKIEGKIRGFDEYMNMVLEDVEELYVKKQERRALGTILLKGDAMALITAAP
ncbi:putative small nuclear ribonucleoprotein E [Babesia bovis T2Bo]|uniref:Small nuclear ribonucleoprotein E n=1 Tax=Babesia bovis TaxID=5865 RepID=A7AVN5_BABBO|nr:putative small nuclear ribonucleoprotein E [Babesia bovis T2Bo]EDO05861.1 putative small nuclear ribonucleoprotein E [Babesia bovis T2Bo]|eukprot:XP_001609429.1 small nuclear ribonucleoprotein E [Babesia bovis T2Bo]